MCAIDFCKNALIQAALNADEHEVDINFLHMDILNESDSFNLPNYDVIISNPPYVCENEVSVDSNIHFEPFSSIFVPNDNPLIFYKAICQFAKKHLNKGGKIYLEINHNFSDDLLNMFINNGYLNVKIHKDFYGKKRFIVVYS